MTYTSNSNLRYRNLSPEPNQVAEKQLQRYLRAEDPDLFADLLRGRGKNNSKLFNQFE